MGFLDGLKTLWSNPEVRDKAIACTMGATAVACAATYAVARAVSRKDREYLNEGRVVTIDGELYRELPNGELRPYFADRTSQTDAYKECDYECYEDPTDADDIIYIKGRPYVMDDRGNYVPVRMPSVPKRRGSRR